MNKVLWLLPLKLFGTILRLFSNMSFHQINFLCIVFDIGEQWFHELQISKFIELYLRCFEDTTTDLVIAALIYVERLLEAAIK